jgi:hypothetical protein
MLDNARVDVKVPSIGVEGEVGESIRRETIFPEACEQE